MPPIIQRMALLKIIARMIKTTPRVINVFLPRLEVFVSIATLSATVTAVTPPVWATTVPRSTKSATSPRPRNHELAGAPRNGSNGTRTRPSSPLHMTIRRVTRRPACWRRCGPIVA